MLNIVLVEPEIPANTGNISRTCAVTGAALHMVRPFGFSVDDKHLKRAGLDYWQHLNLSYYDSYAEVEARFPGSRFWLASTHSGQNYASVTYQDGDFLVFGKETAGLGPLLEGRNTIRIPMLPKQRSLNLSNSVAIVLYEALRQLGYPWLV